ncbi:hypothetical protein BW721_08575 [Jeotgalibaca sp. PTS2502]|uniref:hypothetical protein n=1 Tax=Jeotgalibaca sp. PTS2502 TaxID=1903686 RepID=UPI0009737206|nr:hypothetical protein [Jeotgalibaca sp. PTS2502]APZ49709.1 hypothetical protein BW721_08575 [Jeotgalibaca sp. PTS2502]
MAIDEKCIEYYMNLDRKINRAKERIARQQILFYSQTMSSYITSDGLKVYSRGFSVEKNVCRYVDKEVAMKKGLEIMEFQYRYFKRFFEQLPHNTKIALMEKYWLQKPIEMQTTEKLCLNEINEIEEACIHCFGYSVFEDWEDDTEERDPKKAGEYQEVMAEDFQDMLNLLNI